jgi:hypothetical protein
MLLRFHESSEKATTTWFCRSLTAAAAAGVAVVTGLLGKQGYKVSRQKS